MRRNRLRLLGIVVLLASLNVSGAGKIADFDVVCPLFGHQFQAQALVKDHPTDVQDSDFCKRSVGESPYVLAVWTCPYCFFSAYQAEFRSSTVLDPALRDMELRGYPIDPENIQQAEIFVALKYFNAETYYLQAGKDARFLADLTLRGSWACRVFEVPEPAEVDALRQKVLAQVPGSARMRNAELLNIELEKKVRELLESGAVPEGQTEVHRFLQADALRQSGEHFRAQALFDTLVKEARLPDAYVRSASHKAFLCSKEGEFQERTLGYLQDARDQDLLPDDELATTAYLEAELSRRLGHYDEARALFEKAMATSGASDELKEMIRRQSSRVPQAEAEGGEED